MAKMLVTGDLQRIGSLKAAGPALAALKVMAAQVKTTIKPSAEHPNPDAEDRDTQK